MEQNKNALNELINTFLTLNAFEFSLLAVIIGFIASNKLNSLQQNSVGNFFELIGQVMLTMGAQNQTIGPQPISQEQYNFALSEIRKKIANIDKIIDDFNNIEF